MAENVLYPSPDPAGRPLPSGEGLLLMDGAMGTLISGDEKDFLNLSAPEIIRTIHRKYLEAGAEILKTNTFNANSGNRDFEISFAGAQLARELANEMTTSNPAQPRFVAGSMGPGRAGATFDEQARGLMEGGVDFFLAETITSISVARTQLAAFEALFARAGRRIPVMLSITISREGHLLSGETLEAFWQSVSGARLYSVGINCGFGARHMGPFLEKLARLAASTSTRISCHPSAGLPNASGAYDESPEEFARILHGYAARGWASILGGCCGTTPAHIRAIAHATIGRL